MAEFLRESGEDTALGESFGQRRPPLHEMIKDILREYPSGQIFKVSTLESPGITDYICMAFVELLIILTSVRFYCICQFNTVVVVSLSTVSLFTSVSPM